MQNASNIEVKFEEDEKVDRDVIQVPMAEKAKTAFKRLISSQRLHIFLVLVIAIGASYYVNSRIISVMCTNYCPSDSLGLSFDTEGKFFR